MTKEQIEQLHTLTNEELITNIVILSAQYQASIELGYYFQDQLKKQPKNAYVVTSEVKTDDREQESE